MAEPAPTVERATAVVLASRSPRRRELLERVGVAVVVDPADVDESVEPDEDAATYVQRLAGAKATVVAARHPGRVVVAADTAVVLDGEVLGQPTGDDHAAALLRRLSGRTHRVLTAVAVVAPDGTTTTEVAEAAVTVGVLSDAEVARYVATGEPTGKAGGYAVQGIGAALVERVEGDPTTVIGLPLRPTLRRLGALGGARDAQ